MKCLLHRSLDYHNESVWLNRRREMENKITLPPGYGRFGQVCKLIQPNWKRCDERRFSCLASRLRSVWCPTGFKFNHTILYCRSMSIQFLRSTSLKLWMLVEQYTYYSWLVHIKRPASILPAPVIFHFLNLSCLHLTKKAASSRHNHQNVSVKHTPCQ